MIGHRGAAGYLPDHALEGYELAIKLGADYIEPDLVATKDCSRASRAEHHRHDRRGEPSRVRRPLDDQGRRRGRRDDFFASDFTLAEIKTLRAVQPLAERPQQFNGRFEIPTRSAR